MLKIKKTINFLVITFFCVISFQNCGKYTSDSRILASQPNLINNPISNPQDSLNTGVLDPTLPKPPGINEIDPLYDPNKPQAKVFTFDYFPAGVPKGHLSKDYCNKKYPKGKYMGTNINSSIPHSQRKRYFVDVSNDQQLYIVATDGDELPTKNPINHVTDNGYDSGTKLQLGSDALCFASWLISQGHHPSKIQIIQQKPTANKPFILPNGNIPFQQGGPGLYRQCSSGPNLGKLFIQVYGVYEKALCPDGPTGHCNFPVNFYPNNNNETPFMPNLVSEYDLHKYNFNNNWWPGRFGIDTVNEYVLRHSHVLGEDELKKGHPCPGQF